jgi:transposase
MSTSRNEQAASAQGYIGIDVSKAKLDVMLLFGERREGQTFANSPEGFERLHKWIRRRLDAACVHVCLEATGRYSDAVAESLVEHGYTVSVINPARIKKFGESQLQRNKTDKLDAALIAEYCQRMQPPSWTPPSPEVRELQALVRHLEDLKTARQQAVNRLKASASLPAIIEHLKAQIALLTAQIAEVEGSVSEHLEAHRELKEQRDLLDSIPGVGDLTIARLIAECPTLRTFTDAGQLVAFAGLNPRQHQSGESVQKKTGISKVGSASLRAALYMPAVTAMKHNPIIRVFADRLRSRGVHGKALIVAAMRKLLHVVVGVLKSGKPFNPSFAVRT